MAEASKATLAALVWLHERGHDDMRGGDLVNYYAEREAARLRAEGIGWMAGHHTTSRTHAWRRTGGAVLGRAQQAGLIRQVRISWGTPIYKWTDAGREAVRQANAAASPREGR